jgi:heme/copper-type cytochrome/quinol oxidase subunit 3
MLIFVAAEVMFFAASFATHAIRMAPAITCDACRPAAV